MSPHILVSADQLGDEYYDTLRAACAGWATIERCGQTLPAKELSGFVARADVVVGWADPAHLLNGKTLLYLCGSAGLDAYVGKKLEAKPGFRICNAAGVMSSPIAEHVLALMFAFTRELPLIFRQQIRHHWERRWAAQELAGTTVCIVGVGGAGSELARRCQALGMRVIGVRRGGGALPPHTDEVFPVSALHAAVRTADHVVAVVPGGPHTRHLFNTQVFAAMKPGACYYTAARGSVTDESALIAALRSGHLGGAGLDVFAEEPLPATSPLWELENVIVSPHSAGLSRALPGRLCALFVDNLNRYRRGEPLRNEIDLSTYAAPLA